MHKHFYNLLTLIILLLVAGLVIGYDVSFILGKERYGDQYHFFTRQLFWTVIGVAFFFLVSKINTEVYKKYTTHFFLIALFLLILTIIPNKIFGFTFNIFAPELNGAQRWLYLNPSPLPSLPVLGRLGFQTSEFVKLLGILVFASFFSQAKETYNSGWEINKRFLIYMFLILVPILLQPNLSTTVILACIFSGIYLLSNVPKLTFLLEIPVLLLIFIILMFSSEYRRDRIQTLISGQDENSYQINQILIALGSGGLMGKGIGASIQKYSYVPEVNTDSIFAIIGEEFGLLGTTAILIVYFMLIQTCLSIANLTDDLYSKYIVYGITIWLFVQMSINLLAITKIIPLTGIPLPLLSYGGSSTIFLLCGLGLVLNISKQIDYGE